MPVVHAARPAVRLRRPRAALLGRDRSSCTTTSTTRPTSTGANTTLDKLAEARDSGRLRHHQPAAEEPRVPPLRPRAALDVLAEPVPRRRRQARRRRSRPRSTSDFGSLRRRSRASSPRPPLNVQGSGWGALTWEPLGQRLHRRAGLRPPEQRRPGRAAAARARRVGARLLPAVQEREGRLGQGVLGDRQLARRRGPLRRGPRRSSSSDRAGARRTMTGSVLLAAAAAIVVLMVGTWLLSLVLARRVDRRPGLAARLRGGGVGHAGRAAGHGPGTPVDPRGDDHDLGPAPLRLPGLAQARRAGGPPLPGDAAPLGRPLPAHQPAHRVRAPGRPDVDRLAAGAARPGTADAGPRRPRVVGIAVWLVGFALRDASATPSWPGSRPTRPARDR